MVAHACVCVHFLVSRVQVVEEWLAASDAPVVYVSMGTIFTLRDSAVLALVRGLLAAGARVLWKTRKFDAGVGVLASDGLADLAAVRQAVVHTRAGTNRTISYLTSPSLLVASWVTSQVDVLSHPGVTVFLSHCGHNSVFESHAVGAPVLCAPFGDVQVMMGLLLVHANISSTVLSFESQELEQQTEWGVR